MARHFHSIAPYNLIMSVFVSSNDVTAIGGMYPRLAAIGADVATIGGMYLSLGTCYRTLVRFTGLSLCEYLDNCICVTHGYICYKCIHGTMGCCLVCCVRYSRKGGAFEVCFILFMSMRGVSACRIGVCHRLHRKVAKWGVFGM